MVAFGDEDSCIWDGTPNFDSNGHERSDFEERKLTIKYSAIAPETLRVLMLCAPIAPKDV